MFWQLKDIPPWPVCARLPPISLLPSPRVVSLIKQCAWGGRLCSWVRLDEKITRCTPLPLSPSHGAATWRVPPGEDRCQAKLGQTCLSWTASIGCREERSPPFSGGIWGLSPRESPFPSRRCPGQIGTGAWFSTEGGAGLVLYGFVYFQLISLMDRLQAVYTLHSTVSGARLDGPTKWNSTIQES